MNLDQKLLKRLNANGIILKHTDITREQALVLLCQKCMENTLRIWKTELFPDCRLEDFSINVENLERLAAKLNHSEAKK